MRMQFNANGPVANLVMYRSDGHELSLSSMSNALCEFDATGECVNDYGPFTSIYKFLEVAAEFRKGEEE